MSLSIDLPTVFRATANLVVLVHVLFVVFVVVGGFLVARWPRLAWVHVPVASWGVFIEFRGWICPLTPLENYLRQRGGSSTYQGEFIEHYILPLLYPANLTPRVQIWLGSFALMVNVALYLHPIPARSRSRRACGSDGDAADPIRLGSMAERASPRHLSHRDGSSELAPVGSAVRLCAPDTPARGWTRTTVMSAARRVAQGFDRIEP
jgi:hypothetical protein